MRMFESLGFSRKKFAKNGKYFLSLSLLLGFVGMNGVVQAETVYGKPVFTGKPWDLSSFRNPLAIPIKSVSPGKAAAPVNTATAIVEARVQPVNKLAIPADMEMIEETWRDEPGMPMDNLPPTPKYEPAPERHPIYRVLNFWRPIPALVISSGFGPRWGRPHEGIDIAAPNGTDIHAAEAGRVTYSGVKGGYGKFVAIDHGGGYSTRYGHASKLLVRTGQSVSQGQVIAKVGSTGRSTGPHLHFEVISDGVPQNPIEFINKAITIAIGDQPSAN